MKYNVRFATEEEEKKAWIDLEAWGYEFVYEDYMPTTFIVVGEGASWVFFEWLNGNTVCIHMMAEPAHRGKWFTRHVYQGILYAAELMGVKRIYTVADEGADVVAYVKRLKWKQDEIGWYRDV